MNNNLFIYKFDILGKQVSLFSFGEYRKKTLFGSFMSFILFISILILSIIFIYQWSTGENMSLNFNQYTIYENTSFLFNLTRLAFVTNFKLNIDFNLSFYYKNELEEITKINFSVCNPNQDENTKILYCFNDNFLINFNNVFEYNILFYSEIIMNITSNNIFNNETKFNQFKNNPPKIIFFFDDPLYEHSNRKNPIKKIGIQFSTTFPLNLITSYNYSFIYSQYNTDDGYIFNDKKIYHSYFLNQLPFIYSFNINEQTGYFGFMSLNLSPFNAEKYNRKYNKLAQVVSEIGGIISLLKIIFESIVDTFTFKLFFYNMLYNVIQIENNENNNNKNWKIKNSSKNKSISINNMTVLESLNGVSKNPITNVNSFQQKIIKLPKINCLDDFCFLFRKRKIQIYSKLSEEFIKKYLSCENIIINNCYNEKIMKKNQIVSMSVIRNFNDNNIIILKDKNYVEPLNINK